MDTAVELKNLPEILSVHHVAGEELLFTNGKVER